MSNHRELERAAHGAIAAANGLKELEAVRVQYLGKKSVLAQETRTLGALPPEERRVRGEQLNRLRVDLEQALAARRTELEAAAQQVRYAQEAVDITLPGSAPHLGMGHPLEETRQELQQAFLAMGFSIAEGPEVETDEINFQALNMGPDHPARDMQDSFYLGQEVLLRTHTSPVQIRSMRQMAPRTPLRIVAPGRVFRRDDDVTHSPVFHQVEGLWVDPKVSLADLKGTLAEVLRALFGPSVGIRLRPSYFPFTEPSVEVDLTCIFCGAKGCRVCKETGYIEILGAGMVHPSVLRAGGYDPQQVRGFAFGMGIERVAMLRMGIGDVRMLYQNDLRFLGSLRAREE